MMNGPRKIYATAAVWKWTKKNNKSRRKIKKTVGKVRQSNTRLIESWAESAILLIKKNKPTCHNFFRIF